MTDVTEAPRPTKDRLIRAAALLFRQRGYNGVGLNELLEAADAPKGSLYHHFPNGKSDLALAAADWASDEMLRLVAASFGPAESFEAGVTTLCHKLAKLFDITGQAEGCPVSGALSDDPDNAAFRDRAAHIFEGWISEVAHYAVKHGASDVDARNRAEMLFMLLEGAWVLARARRDSDVLRSLPARLPG